MKKLSFAVLVLCLAACGKPSDGGKDKAGGPLQDAPAPRISLDKFVLGDLKAVKGWEDLRGKAVVLEFWATWCSPCVSNIPHMNELADKFKDRPVVFLSVTRDQRGAVEKFLKKHEMKGNVAVEAGEAFKAFKVRGIPHTVLVDKEGVIRAFSYPSRVTPESVEALLAGKPIPGAIAQKPEEEPEEEKPAAPAPAGRAEKGLAFFYVLPSEDENGGSSTETSDFYFYSEGETLGSAIEELMSDSQAVEYRRVPETLLARRVDIRCRVAKLKGVDNKARLRRTVISGLSGAFPLSISTEKARRKVLLLRKLPGAAGPAAVSASGELNFGRGGKKLSVSTDGYAIEGLRERLQAWLDRPVLDESGLPGPRRYSLETGASDVKGLNEALKWLGLTLEEEEREIELAVVAGA